MDKLQRFFSDNWAIERREFANMLALLAPCIIKGNLDQAEKLIAARKCRVRATAAPYLAKWYELDDISLPVDSVAVIYLTGMLYAWETRWLIETIEAAKLNPQISGIVLVIDGPGGMVSGIDAAVAAIKGANKPTATVVAGTMASAHFWLGTSTERTFIASQLCEVGSVGVMTTYTSFKKFFETNGIDVRDIYPDTADLKNHEFRALEEDGDEGPIKERLALIHKIFADTVAENLGITYDPELELFRGAMFTADVAVAAGYIDQFGTVADAVTWVLAMATSRKAAQYNY